MATFLPPGSSGAFEWLPDGSGLVYTVVSNGVENIWLQPSDGGEPRQLTHFDQGRLGDIDVSPDVEAEIDSLSPMDRERIIKKLEQHIMADIRKKTAKEDEQTNDKKK